MHRFEGVARIVIIGFIGLALSVDVTYAQNPTPLQPPNDPLMQGSSIYLGHCASCHGLKGDGKSADAKRPMRSLPDFSDQKFMKSRTDNDLEQAILVGKPGTVMQGYGTILSPRDLSDLIKYLRSLSTTK
jgi:high-affinity iron transporter